MKTLLVSLLLLVFSSADWLTNFDMAKEIAAKENKYILLNFAGSDWCGPCIQMTREVFNSNTFQEYASGNLVLVRADFPRLKKNQLEKSQVQHNEALAERYNPTGKFPLTILLNANGDLIKTWDGFNHQTPEAFVTEVKTAIKK